MSILIYLFIYFLLEWEAELKNCLVLIELIFRLACLTPILVFGLRR